MRDVNLEEIPDLLARVENFCATVGKQPLGVRVRGTLEPVDDKRLLLVPNMRDACEQIRAEIGFAAKVHGAPEEPDQARMLAESSHRLDRMLDWLRGLLYQAKANKIAYELMRDVRCAAERHKENSAKGGRKGGFKGGRPSDKPSRAEIRNAYNRQLAQCGSEDARANLVKELVEAHHVAATTARAWVRDAKI